MPLLVTKSHYWTVYCLVIGDDLVKIILSGIKKTKDGMSSQMDRQRGWEWGGDKNRGHQVEEYGGREY